MVKTGRRMFAGYADCLTLENASTRVTLGHQCGGRVMEYALHSVNVLLQDPTQDGWTLASGKPPIEPSAGRFDIGPEAVIPRHPELWFGAWTAEFVGTDTVRLTSVRDAATGAQLVRTFTLDADSSHLRCTQTIINISDQTTQLCHWSRTFATGHGICVVPLTSPSRFPHHYLLYGPGPVMNFLPEDPNIVVKDGFLTVIGPPKESKLGIDSRAGWLAYLTRQDMMFVKRYPTYDDRVYNEMAGLTLSVWYFHERVCELEPIGPREILEPGQSASFTEDWWILPYAFPENPAAVEVKNLADLVNRVAR